LSDSRFCRLRVAAFAAALLGASTSAGAAPILEVEINDSIAAAQAIPPGAFTLPVAPTVFDSGNPTGSILGSIGIPNDVDFYQFSANGGSVYLDIDGTAPDSDTMLALFDSFGTLLAFGDDSFPADPGSSDLDDAFLGVYTLPGAGTYYAAVSAFANAPAAALTAIAISPLVRPDGWSGGLAVNASAGLSAYLGNGATTSGYTLHITLQNPVSTAPPAPAPEPATMLMLGTGISVIAARVRRRR
jgi:hypothetical protein